MSAPDLAIQTAYAELLDRCAAAAFSDTFPESGTFVCKTIRNRRYWYFQEPASSGRAQKYAGPETPELLARIEQHREARHDEAQRRALVSTLLRVQRSPRPPRAIGDVVSALEKAGAFRLRAVLIGTVAFQTYSAALGVPFGGASVGTEDVDIAQFGNISVAVADRIPPLLDVLHEADRTFRPVPHVIDGRRVTRYRTKGGLRVDFLTPNEGKETSGPKSLPALRTDAEPLRFLDFLIHEPEPAVVLHGPGVYVLVPAPQRFAVHKLIVSRRRSAGNPKRDKDIAQAAALLGTLAQKRPFELQEAWREANARGAIWRKLLSEALTLLPEKTRQTVLPVIAA